MKLTKAALIILCACAGPLTAQSYLSGTVYRADGKTPVQADIVLTSIDGQAGWNELQAVKASPDGTFSLTVEKPGTYRLWVCMPDHFAKSVPLVVKENERISFELTAAPYFWKDSIDAVEIVGSWNDYAANQAEPMHRRADGTFIYSRPVSEDTVGYQLKGLLAMGSRPVNGTQADYFEYDGHGTYRSMLHVRGDSVHIVFDPARLFRVAADADVPKITFDAEHRNLKELFALTLARNENILATVRAYDKHMQEHGDPQGFSFRDSSYIAILEETIQRSEDEAVRQMAAVNLLTQVVNMEDKRRETVVEMMEVIPPDSPWLALQRGQSVMMIAMLAPEEKSEGYLKKVLESNPEKSVRGQVVAHYVNKYAKKDPEKFQHYYEMLKNEFADLPSARFTLMRHNPERVIQAGKPVPDFEVGLMDSEEKVSRQSLLGKTYLMDFWAVWCGPCVAEMPSLHTAYEKFKDKGLIILSLSFDQKPEDVHEFRAEKWPMPWLHTFIEGGGNSELAKRFEVVGIPKPILVGPDGTILALEGELRGQALEKTLAKYLGDVSEK